MNFQACFDSTEFLDKNEPRGIRMVLWVSFGSHSSFFTNQKKSVGRDLYVTDSVYNDISWGLDHKILLMFDAQNVIWFDVEEEYLDLIHI